MTISIHQFIKDISLGTLSYVHDKVELTGWLTIVGGKLMLLDEGCSSGDFEKGDALAIENSDIVYAVRDNILPLGGGGSFVFHKAKVVGNLVHTEFPCICVSDIYICEKDGIFFSIDIGEASIEMAKRKYGEVFLKSNSGSSKDWLDFVDKD